MKNLKKIISIAPGDGIGPEVMAQAILVLDAISKKFGHTFTYVDVLVGGASIDALGEPMTNSELEKILKTDALLHGSIGGADDCEWNKLPNHLRPEAGILKMRQALGDFANFRPAIVYDELVNSSPLKAENVAGLDILILRELLGDIYFGKHFTSEDGKSAYDIMEYTEFEIERAADEAFKAAMKRNKKVCSVDKANVLDSSKLWRRVVTEVAEKYPEVELSHMFVDNAAMQLVKNPKQFDVILTGNIFGDILSDLASVFGGSLGTLPSASLGGEVAYYEPAGGSAPDIAGKDIANPIAQILSASMLLLYSFDLKEEAKLIEDAIKQVLADGYRTGDIKTSDTPENKIVGCSQMGKLIVDAINGIDISWNKR